jgi:hypothetical protein
LKLCVNIIEPCVKLGIDGGRLSVHGEAVVIKLSVGVGERFGHGDATCVEVIPRHGHKAKSIWWKVGLLENYN